MIDLRKGKGFFYTGMALLIIFEVANVYFIMPLPGSQKMNSIGLAYTLYRWRWAFRALFGLLSLMGIVSAFRARRIPIAPVLLLLLWAAVTWLFNFKMTADSMFKEPKTLSMKDAAASTVDTGRIVLGVEINGEAAAFPIQYLAYHHRVQYQLGGTDIWPTYCSVCRTGRVFEPKIDGKPEQFRLVGMDHFNAMFEDRSTHSWWRQVNGECIAGKSKGKTLPEIASVQMSLGQWIRLHPKTLIMQPDPAFAKQYASLDLYESGRKTGSLERRDSAAWKDKSWVAGVVLGDHSRAYDWNLLKQQRCISDTLGGQSILICLAADDKSFAGFLLPSGTSAGMQGDSLSIGGHRYDLLGRSKTAVIPNKKP